GVMRNSPATGVERPAQNAPGERTLDDSEIAALWWACGEEGVFGAFVRVLLLSGARRSEVSGMRWSEISEAERLWQLPRERTKNGVPHAIPLAPQAWAVSPCSRPDPEAQGGIAVNPNTGSLNKLATS